MFAPPILAVVDLNVENRLSRAPTVVMHEHIGFLQQIEISQPGQISRLQDHERRHENPLRLRMDLLRSPAPAGEIMLSYSFASPTEPQCAA
jgi:hypothetical protein